MAKRKVAKTSFNGGVQSPLLHGMIDAPKGASSFQASQNMVPLKYGPITRRGGTEFVAETTGDSGVDKGVQLVSFNYNDEQAYILEFSSLEDNRMKVYKDKGLVLESESNLNQRVMSIPAVSHPSNIVINVDVDGTDYTVGAEVVLTGLSEATYLNNEIRTIVATSASSVTIGSSEHATAETSTEGILSQVYELTIPYSASDMFASDGTFRLDVRQYNDVMYIAHPDYQTRVLTRAGDDNWSIDILEYDSGPYLPDNIEKNNRFYLSPWRTEGSIADYKYATIVSKTAEEGEEGVANNIFSPSDVQLVDDRGLTTLATDAGETWLGTSTNGGRMISIFVPQGKSSNDRQQGHRWHHLKIVKYISPNEVWVERMASSLEWSYQNVSYSRNWLSVDMRPNQWALGAFSESTGYPSVIEIHDSRLILGATTEEPDTLHFSEIGGFSTTTGSFRTVDTDGQVYDDHGFNTNISAGNASPMQWISSSSDGLLVGTYSSEGVISSNDRGKGFVPGNVSYRRNTTVGSKSMQPLMIDQSTLFISRTGRRIHEMIYDISTTGQEANDLTERAEHVTESGVIDMAFQREPVDTLWCVLSNGKLISLTFDKRNEIDAWTEHALGGDDVVARSVATIPSGGTGQDQVWIAVDRSEDIDRVYGGDGTRRTIEVISKPYDSDESIIDVKNLDSYKSISTTQYSASVTVGPRIIQGSVSHGLSENDIVFISGFELYDYTTYSYSSNPPETTISRPTANQLRDTTARDLLNNNYFRAVNVSSTRFNIETLSGNAISISELYPDDWGNPQVGTLNFQSVTTSINGNSIFGGKIVDMLIDGRHYRDQYIDSEGDTILNDGVYGANITIGYPYTSYVELKNLEGTGIQNPDQGKAKRVTRLFVRLLNSLGLKHGDSEANLFEEEFDSELEISDFRDLVTGDYVFDFDGDYEKSGTIRLQGDGPYPLTIQGLVAEMDVEGYVSNQ